MSDRIALKDTELLYAATARCRCGAGLAYPLAHEFAMKVAAWVCSRVLKHEVEGQAYHQWPHYLRADEGQQGEHDAYGFAFYKVREETSIRNEGGHTTRPCGTVARTVGKATCPKCQHKWESEPYVACGLGHHWFPGPCPECGYDVGGGGSWSTKEGPAIDVRYHDVVLEEKPHAT